MLDEGATQRTTIYWLSPPVKNLYKIIYEAAKTVYSERSLCRKHVDRAVNIRRTARFSQHLTVLREKY